MKGLTKKIYTDTTFINIINDILDNEMVKKMRNYRQHNTTNCYDHCLTASYYCYKICKKFHLDYISCSRAAMLHDLFLYDWRKRENERKGFHAFTHPLTAYKNASNLFKLNNKEKDIILKHMWPVTIIPPKYIESYILTLVDKYCACAETFENFNIKLYTKKAFRYTYVFLCLLFINI